MIEVKPPHIGKHTNPPSISIADADTNKVPNLNLKKLIVDRDFQTLKGSLQKLPINTVNDLFSVQKPMDEGRLIKYSKFQSVKQQQEPIIVQNLFPEDSSSQFVTAAMSHRNPTRPVQHKLSISTDKKPGISRKEFTKSTINLGQNLS